MEYIKRLIGDLKRNVFVSQKWAPVAQLTTLSASVQGNTRDISYSITVLYLVCYEAGFLGLVAARVKNTWRLDKLVTWVCLPRQSRA